MALVRDVVIVGGGHNGLAAAFYLARAGRRPLVLERRPVVGGAAITDEFHPGFRVSTLACMAGPLRPEVARDMRLDRHGLRIIRSEARVFAPSDSGSGLVLYGDPARTSRGLSALSPKDAARYVEFHYAIARIASALGGTLSITPPAIDDPSAGDLWNMLRVGRRVRGLGRRDLYRLLRWGPMAVADLVAEFFETDLLRAAIASRGVFGTFLGPRSAGTAAVLLLRAAVDGHPVGTVAVPEGGLGALTRAMAAAARDAGAEVRTGAEVARISVRDGRASGVVLASGEEIGARTVVSNADPRRTFLRLLDPAHLDPDFLQKVRNYRSVGAAAKVNLALSGLPGFTGPGSPAGGDGAGALSGRIHIGPGLDYLERAFDDAKYGDPSRRPYLDVTIPTIADPSLAPPGRHVLSAYVQYAPYSLSSGDWRRRREELGDTVVSTLSRYAPDLPGLILHRQIISPLDLEEIYGLTGGHISHGEMTLDQLFAMRPILGWARYRTPIEGLYLCGAGTHPGGGVTGAPGANAAREILKDRR
ncbi:MAG: phytoene desaturase family protein [Acidobacteriota bacterium]